MHAHIHTHVYRYTHINIHAHTYSHITHAAILTQIHTRARPHTQRHTHMHTQHILYIHTPTYICIRTHIHTTTTTPTILRYNLLKRARTVLKKYDGGAVKTWKPLVAFAPRQIARTYTRKDYPERKRGKAKSGRLDVRTRHPPQVSVPHQVVVVVTAAVVIVSVVVVARGCCRS